MGTAVGCGSWDGMQTAASVRARYELQQADLALLERLELAGGTAAIRSAAHKYRLALGGQSAALLVNSALAFGARHGDSPALAPPASMDALLGSTDVARSRLLLSIVDAPPQFKIAGLRCVYDYDRCVLNPQATPMACNAAWLQCLDPALVSGTRPGD